MLPDAGAPDPTEPIPVPFGPHWSAAVGPGALTPEGYQDAVRAGLAAIAAGEVSKVVLARDLAGTVPAGSDLRRLVRSLASGYPDTWVYAVHGLIGASPETLVTVAGGTVTARVLAGTVARGADPDSDREAALALASSVKDLDEHGYAVRSLIDALTPHTSALAASEQPFTLALPNVWHLATDVEATTAADTSVLDLIAVLHPTAAVAGTPTDAALAAIARIEPSDRGRYAGRSAGSTRTATASGRSRCASAVRPRRGGRHGHLVHGARRRGNRRWQRPRGRTARDPGEVPAHRRRPCLTPLDRSSGTGHARAPASAFGDRAASAGTGQHACGRPDAAH
ncbi:MAG: chorismate-binding protein [Microbacterium sp.]